MTDLRRLVRNGVLLAAVACLAVGCVTKAQVQQIVAHSNAAMISPYIDIANQPGDWEQAVAGMDEFIAAYPDNVILVNQLRVRQAMLLTVNGRRNLAELRWDEVDGAKLGERDRSLHACGKILAWWYVAANLSDVLDAAEATAAITKLNETIKDTTAGSDIRIFLATIRGQIVMRMGRDGLLSHPGRELPDRLAAYVEAIGADAQWLADLEGLDLDDARQIRAFRYRIWLRELIGSYKRAATDLELDPPPTWRPDWVVPVR